MNFKHRKVNIGDLVRLVQGHDRTYNVQGQFGIVISCHRVNQCSDTIELFDIKIKFPNYIWSHPCFPITLLDVINVFDETR